jgi:hypothetical protein
MQSQVFQQDLFFSGFPILYVFDVSTVCNISQLFESGFYLSSYWLLLKLYIYKSHAVDLMLTARGTLCTVDVWYTFN